MTSPGLKSTVLQFPHIFRLSVTVGTLITSENITAIYFFQVTLAGSVMNEKEVNDAEDSVSESSDETATSTGNVC